MQRCRASGAVVQRVCALQRTWRQLNKRNNPGAELGLALARHHAGELKPKQNYSLENTSGHRVPLEALREIGPCFSK
ncbi:hypothetical protein NDU88_003979 [Pleurodeles waltl]|uniref:Uncharacterized protein n=1 Tax=Pleurodeles waltl TaxID=8319 RepID=A0AAV7WUK3_PLEWA|nr:hypothetical protein NDU88_003979 [Pleurodeles waltl]